ncbi:MAG: Tol-Pal system beta propeller repeat protein TolB [Magnetococcales bacterium]|nr:Tol-Pal system beta propeller repeat protein TolB [Magnetococcales bacterium]
MTNNMTVKKQKLLLMILAVIGCCWLAWIQPAAAAMRIDISKGGLEAMPIALPSFVDDGAAGQGYGQRMVQVIAADLESSGFFKVLDQKSFLQEPGSLMREGPNYREWRLIGAEALVSGAVRSSGDQMAVDFYIYDVFQGQLFRQGQRFSGPASNWRYIAHRVADEIYHLLTGEKGYFASRIAFIAEKGGQKWLSLIDQDGTNRVDLMRGSSLALTPRFAPDGNSLFYVAFEKDATRIYRFDLYSGQRTPQGDYPGLNISPAISPDGSRMAMTLSKDGNPEIYVKNLNDGQMFRLTDNNAIDTSPSWSPDGRRIVFNSNRAGSPQLYIMEAMPGAEARRITFEGSYNSAPSWSPQGDLIAFVHGGGGKFRIAVMDANGGRMRVMTDSWMDESPVWSPNGRVILFSRQVGNLTRLYTIDVTGHNERAVPMESGIDASDPSWSPLVR